MNILVDNESWILPYTKRLVESLCEKYECSLIRNQNDLTDSDVTFFLGCTKIVKPENLAKSKFNLVVHESALPKGKGFAPMAWQIIEGSNRIPICLIQADKEADSGDIWLEDYIELEGNELCDEWRDLQGKKTIEICEKFITNFSSLVPKKQKGNETFYKRRRPIDSEINLNKSIEEQFNLLRTVNNKDYPAFFIRDGIKYKLELTKMDEDE
ncbi:MAG: methionyl-tRNA formyltransferase [Pseudomonas sp.]|nr:methionyl-tRNA formyltransferase [Pseudomonas sp.]